MGKVKVVLKYGYIILRLELCVVVLGVEIYEIIFDEFEFELWKVIFFIDSKVVFGYINNEINFMFMLGIVLIVLDVLYILVNGIIY